MHESRFAGRNRKAHRFSGGKSYQRPRVPRARHFKRKVPAECSAVPTGLLVIFERLPSLKGWARSFVPLCGTRASRARRPLLFAAIRFQILHQPLKRRLNESWSLQLLKSGMRYSRISRAESLPVSPSKHSQSRSASNPTSRTGNSTRLPSFTSRLRALAEVPHPFRPGLAKGGASLCAVPEGLGF